MTETKPTLAEWARRLRAVVDRVEAREADDAAGLVPLSGKSEAARKLEPFPAAALPPWEEEPESTRLTGELMAQIERKVDKAMCIEGFEPRRGEADDAPLYINVVEWHGIRFIDEQREGESRAGRRARIRREQRQKPGRS
jgi:hypothetical protein